MINNRQAGRRRGRNNPRQNGGGSNRGNGGDSGNRIDNRARGNAAQLLEKYRNMARDAQLVGDRVNMEYYLQFADHYFRVLADNRARQEESQQRFRKFDDTDQDEEFNDEDDVFNIGDIPPPYSPRQYEPRPVTDEGRRDREDGRRDEGRNRDDSRGREEGRGREDNRNRDDNRSDNRNRDDTRGRDDNRVREDTRNRDDNRPREDVRPREDARPRDEGRVRENRRPQRERAPAPQPVEAQDAPVAPAVAAPANDVVTEVPAEEARPRATRGRKPRREVEAEQALGLDASMLPPAIGRPAEASTETEEAPAPRRTRRPRSTPAQAAE